MEEAGRYTCVETRPSLCRRRQTRQKSAINLSQGVPLPYDWLYEEPKLFVPTGDDFNDGYLSGFSTTFRLLLLEKFPPEKHKPTFPEEKTWRNTKWGINPADPITIISFQMGAELADKQTTWLPEFQAEEVMEHMRPTGVRINGVAFRFGFLSKMEQKFPRRY